jgi:hypothetical protein
MRILLALAMLINAFLFFPTPLQAEDSDLSAMDMLGVLGGASEGATYDPNTGARHVSITGVLGGLSRAYSNAKIKKQYDALIETQIRLQEQQIQMQREAIARQKQIAYTNKTSLQKQEIENVLALEINTGKVQRLTNYMGDDFAVVGGLSTDAIKHICDWTAEHQGELLPAEKIDLIVNLPKQSVSKSIYISLSAVTGEPIPELSSVESAFFLAYGQTPDERMYRPDLNGAFKMRMLSEYSRAYRAVNDMVRNNRPIKEIYAFVDDSCLELYPYRTLLDKDLMWKEWFYTGFDLWFGNYRAKRKEFYQKCPHARMMFEEVDKLAREYQERTKT